MNFEYAIERLVRQIYKLREKHSYQVINPKEEDAQKIKELRNAIRVLTRVELDYSLPIYQQIESLFRNNMYYYFEAGMDSCFRRDIINLIQENPIKTLESICSLVEENEYGDNILSEVFIILGDEATSETHDSIFELLTIGLKNESAYVRDSAGLGFSSLGDKKAIPLLEEAILVEPIAEMKKDLQQVIEYLEI